MNKRIGGLVALALTLVMVTAAACDDGASEVTLLTHSSFDVSEDVIRAFEERYDAKVNIVQGGDAGETLNRAILTKGDPLADLLFGVDNTLFGRARDAGIFEPYESPNLASVEPRFVFDPDHLVTPVDYGYVNINYDRNYLADHGLSAPKTLDDLTLPAWKGRLVVENPATSSPGLAFLLTTIAYFGEDGGYSWRDYWRDLRANGVLVVDGWEEAYFTSFSHYGGDRPLVVSYATSPGYEWSQATAAQPPTGNLLPDRAVFLQIEGVGLLRGAKHRELARRLIDFMLETPFQSDVPRLMVVYPVNPKAALPEFFKFAEVPAKPVDLDPATIASSQARWTLEWTEIVLR